MQDSEVSHMTYSAVLFGAIGTVAETSELQRRAYNTAFAGFDLDWVWEPDAYYRMLETPGGRGRIADYAEAAGDTVDVDAVHRAKQAVFASLVDRIGLEPRPGVRETVAAARQAGVPCALCTTTTPEQVGLILDGLAPHLTREDFAWIGDRSMVERGKPHPDIYEAALEALGVVARDAVAIEDTPESAAAARAAGIAVIAFPGRAAGHRAFPSEMPRLDALSPAVLRRDVRHAAE
jgi:beta-phosphoglucomutase-like phosphatase (HAD superfamily)